MRDAEALFAESTQSAGRPWLNGRRFGSVLIAVLGLLLLAGAAPAPAAFKHPATPTYSFGATGLEASTLRAPEGIAYNQAQDVIYVIENEPPRKIQAWKANINELKFPPLGAGFPLEVDNGQASPDVEVDNTALPSAGHLLHVRRGQGAGGQVEVFDAQASFLFEVNVLRGECGTCGATARGVDVDNQGHIWVVDQGPEWLEEFKPTGGTAIRRIELDGTILNRPAHIAIDHSNGDIYLVQNGNPNVARLSAASDYSISSLKPYFQEFASENSKLAINGSTNRLYIANLNNPNNKIFAFSTLSGARVEEFGIGGGQYSGIAVDEATDTVYTTNNTTKKVQVWKPVVIPDVTTGPPVGNANVSGSVGLAGIPSPEGNITECKFEWGTTTSYGKPTAACEPAVPYESAKPTVTATLPINELPGGDMEKLLHYRINAKNLNGESKGEDLTITPHWVNSLSTEPATAIQRTGATLNGSYVGTEEETKYYFEYGPPNGAPGVYGNKTTEETEEKTLGPTSLSAVIPTVLVPGATYHYRVVAINSKGTSMAQDLTLTTAPAVMSLETTSATNVEPTTATLNASLDADGIATEYSFEYGKTTAYGFSTPFEGAPVKLTPGIMPVSEDIAGLEAGETYHFRVVAKNSFGTTIGADKTFQAAQTPSLVGVSSTNVAATSADLTAIINPNGFATTYYFEYGTTTAYGSKATVGTGELAAGTTPQPVSVPVANLREGFTHHFRLIAKNKWGTTTSEDQTFDFTPPIGCPNHNIRQETSSAYLPDCRAYELVSPARANGAFLAAFGPRSPFASSPGRFAYAGLLTQIPDSGQPMSSTFSGDLYVSNRTDSGWKTRYVGIPGSESLSLSGQRGDEQTIQFEDAPFPIGGFQEGITDVYSDPGMNEFLVWDRGQLAGINTPAGSLEGTYAPYMYDYQGNFIRRLPTNLEEVPGAMNDVTKGGFRGDSKISDDLRHYVFSSDKLAFAEGGQTTSPGSVYDNNLDTGSLEIVSKTQNGSPIPSTLPYEWIQVAAVTSDASHILMATIGVEGPNPQTPSSYHLYMRDTDAGLTYEVSASENDGLNKGVFGVRSLPDLSKVFFYSQEQLTNDDTDTSIDLYMWTENGGSPDLVRLSQGSGGSVGNTDACSATWTAKCGIQIVPTNAEPGEPPIDSPVASESGDIYFYSPELLDGTKGIPGKRNLYVYRNGAPRHVATIEPVKPLSRIQVTPDGSYMAFVTGTRLTAYNNESTRQMYRYNSVTGAIQCLSCPQNGAEAASQVDGSSNGRYITDDGRVFFSTGDDLVPRDADRVRDIYEYVAGRPQLISSGRSDARETARAAVGLVSVSADGVDAFFATVDTLVGQDENGPYLKFYDARVNGGFPFTKPPAACVAADECHGEESVAPAPLSVGSSAALGSRGNVEATTTKKKKSCKKKKKKKKKSCKSKRQTSRGPRRG